MILRLAKEYGIDEKTSKQYVSTSVDMAKLFEMLVSVADVETARKFTSGPISAGWRSFESDDSKNVDGIVSIVKEYRDGGITDVEGNLRIRSYMTGEDMDVISSGSSNLDEMISEFLDENPNVIEDYRKNDKAANRVIGHVMKQTGGAYSSSDIVEATKRLIGERL